MKKGGPAGHRGETVKSGEKKRTSSVGSTRSAGKKKKTATTKKTPTSAAVSKKSISKKTVSKKTVSKKKAVTKKKTPAAEKEKTTKPSKKAKAVKKSPAKPRPVKKSRSPKSVFMPSVVREFKHELIHKRAFILGSLSRMEDGALRAGGQDQSVDNMADYGTDNYEQDFTLGLMENVESVIQAIDWALERIEKKVFGICDECGCAIPKARIKAIPYARYCVNCQSKMEEP